MVLTRHQSKLHAVKTIALHAARFPERTARRLSHSDHQRCHSIIPLPQEQHSHFHLSVAEIQRRYPFLSICAAVILTEKTAHIIATLYPHAIIASTLDNPEDDFQHWRWKVELRGIDLQDHRNYNIVAHHSIQQARNTGLHNRELRRRFGKHQLPSRDILVPKHPEDPFEQYEIDLLQSPLLQQQL